MAKIVITGNAVVITSAMKFEDILKIKKSSPDALILKGGEDGKEPVFAIGISDRYGSGNINMYGVTFDSETRDQQKLATLTMLTNYSGDNIESYIVDELGTAITNLNKLEETLPAVLEEISAARAEILSNITVTQ